MVTFFFLCMNSTSMLEPKPKLQIMAPSLVFSSMVLKSVVFYLSFSVRDPSRLREKRVESFRWNILFLWWLLCNCNISVCLLISQSKLSYWSRTESNRSTIDQESRLGVDAKGRVEVLAWTWSLVSWHGTGSTLFVLPGLGLICSWWIMISLTERSGHVLRDDVRVWQGSCGQSVWKLDNCSTVKKEVPTSIWF